MKFPMVVLDLETTGVNVREDRIVEISIIKINSLEDLSPEAMEIKKTYINPQIPIPASATECHGITDEMVREAAPFRNRAKAILAFIEGCDIVGYNSVSFDIPLLYNEFIRAGIAWDYTGVNFIDACVIFKRKEERTLSAAVEFYTGNKLEGAHGAEADAKATLDVLLAQLKRYPDLTDDSEALDLYSNYDKQRCDLSGCFTTDDQGRYVLNFGKHKGELAENQRAYIEWMQSADFMPDTKEIIKEILCNTPSAPQQKQMWRGSRKYTNKAKTK